MPTLTIRTREGEEKHTFTDRVIIGRHPGVGLTINDPKISRQHAAVQPHGNHWQLADLASSNGTFIDDTRIYGTVPLQEGDVFRLGTTTFTFNEDEGGKPRQISVELSVVEELDARDGGLSIAIAASDAGALERMRRQLQMMYDIAAVSSETLDEDVLLDAAVKKLFEFFPQTEHVLVLFVENGDFQIARSCNREGSTDAVLSRTVIEHVVTTRRGLLSLDVGNDERIAQSKSISAMLLRSIACVPIISRQQVLGVVQLGASISRPPFTADDLPLLIGVASQIGAGVANARLHRSAVAQEMVNQDLGLARRIQGRFLPASVPEVAGYRFASEYSAALEIGGDYYDFIPLANGRMGIVVGDVSGKGISAALVMARLSSEMRYQAAAPGTASEIVTRLNTAMSRELEEGMFVTLLFTVLDPLANTIDVVNCGHPEPLVRKADGSVSKVTAKRQVPVGVVPDFAYQSTKFDVERGDTFVMFTDGVSEAMDASSNPFGIEKMIAAMKRGDGSPSVIRNQIVFAIDEHAGTVPQHDDVTLVCFGRNA